MVSILIELVSASVCSGLPFVGFGSEVDQRRVRDPECDGAKRSLTCQGMTFFLSYGGTHCVRIAKDGSCVSNADVSNHIGSR